MERACQSRQGETMIQKLSSNDINELFSITCDRPVLPRSTDCFFHKYPVHHPQFYMIFYDLYMKSIIIINL